jgi:3-oxoacyl-[acyl-carrier protein] reductase
MAQLPGPGAGDAPVAVITGGAGGLGFACAHRLAGRGISIALLDLDEDTAAGAAERLPASQARHVGLAADVTSPLQVRTALTRVRAALGPVALLLNAAGIVRTTRFMEIGEAEWDVVVDVSLKGTFVCSQACLPDMLAAGYGRIVNFSSSAGRSVSTIGGAHYTAAKAGVLGLTRAIAKEVADRGVTVNAICPGLFDTEMVRANTSRQDMMRYAAGFPVPRLGQPDEVAELVAYLCSDEAGYITGASIDINGGDLMI